MLGLALIDMPDLLINKENLFENSIVGLGVQRDGRILKANRRLRGMLGYSGQELLLTPLEALYPSPDAFNDLQRKAAAELIQMGSYSDDVQLRHKDGSIFWARCGFDAADRHNLSKGLIWTVLDISDVKQAEQALRESAAQLRLFADNVPAMSIVYDEKLRCVFANKRFAEYFGLTSESIVGKHLRQIVGEQAYREIAIHFERVLQGYPTGYERIRHLAYGQTRYLDVRLTPHFGEQGQVRGLFAVTSDITERKQEEDRIRRLAQYDPLTGVANRMLFDEHLRQAISLGARALGSVALLYIDLDKFKMVNDTFGHDVGDRLLREAAERIAQQVRDSDTVARIGGDEFAVIVNHPIDASGAVAVAQRILKALVAPFHIPSDERVVTIGSSIGVAIYPSNASDAQALVKVADIAMYKAKLTGNCYSFPDQP